MTTYAFPATWKANHFELRILPNTRLFVGPYSPTTQVLDLLGERWVAVIGLPPDNDPAVGAGREAFFDRLKGPANLISLWHLRLPAPQGTMRGSPTLSGAVAQLANTCNIQTSAGATVKAGDMLSLSGQLVRIMADATANGGGVLAVEFQPRARAAWSNGAAVVWDKPTANFMLKSDGVPTAWKPGVVEAASLDLIEVW